MLSLVERGLPDNRVGISEMPAVGVRITWMTFEVNWEN